MNRILRKLLIVTGLILGLLLLAGGAGFLWLRTSLPTTVGTVEHAGLSAPVEVLRDAREQRGAIDFDTVETRIIFDEHKKIDAIVPVVRNDAHKLIEEWLQNPGEGAEQAREPAIVARRIMSFLSQSNLILRDADHEFYQLFIRSLLRQARSLRSSLASTDGVVRLQAIIALLMTGLSLSNQEKLTRFGPPVVTLVLIALLAWQLVGLTWLVMPKAKPEAQALAPAIRGAGEAMGLTVSSESALAAGLVMGIMIIPFVSSLSDDVINAVPQALRDASYALGATRSETIRQVVLPAALPGIIGGILLAASRAIGETMIVVMAAGLSANLTANPLDSVTTVTVQIVTLLVGDQEFDSAKTLAAFALGLLLFVVTLGLNIVALHIVRKYREQYE